MTIIPILYSGTHNHTSLYIETAWEIGYYVR